MPTTTNDGLTLHFETFGDPDDPTVLFVSGLGAQSVALDDALCEAVAGLGRHVVRFDNRDVGLSSHLDDAEVDAMAAVTAAMSGGTVDSPYTLSDMAVDATAVLDALDVGAAHVIGTSMGGMIAQTLAIEHPDRVRSLTSVMSTTGEAEYGAAHPEVLTALLSVMGPRETREDRILANIELARTIGTQHCFDEARARARAEMLVDRSYDPAGVTRQFVAIVASGHRAEGLAGVRVPTAVAHGDADRLVDISGGRRTAELVEGARFVELPGMAHDLPPYYWEPIIDVLRATTSLGEED